ncbi:hypothetical protein HGM15179_020128 [Zosterops borbonicus]|uniref:Uncharacterized protein n=1 Tax=Zosterops borbonicus TaxID=364589 RepID=A0A8K1DAP4_9PASS|nr:hypothetical protein HGM15179_020128 [Zosterops borbonicus]
MVKTMVRQTVSLQPMGINGGCRDTPADHGGGAHTGMGGCLEEAVIQWETQWRERTLASRLEHPVLGSQCPELEDHDCENDKLPVDPELVQYLLLQLDHYKSMGPDEIHLRILKELVDVIMRPLSMIFEQSGESGENPADWKLVNVGMLSQFSRRAVAAWRWMVVAATSSQKASLLEKLLSPSHEASFIWFQGPQDPRYPSFSSPDCGQGGMQEPVALGTIYVSLLATKREKDSSKSVGALAAGYCPDDSEDNEGDPSDPGPVDPEKETDLYLPDPNPNDTCDCLKKQALRKRDLDISERIVAPVIYLGLRK